jgi:hypothetical protein
MPDTPHRNWKRDETLLALRLYCRTPFGKLHRTNPKIIALASHLDRTPSAIGMKACNFASLDPVQRERGITALANVSNLDKTIWSEFAANPESIAAEAEAAYDRLFSAESPRPRLGGEGQVERVSRDADPSLDAATEIELPTGLTEVERLVRTRRVQSFFRATVLTSYENRCALTGLDVPELLNASHIIPWSANVSRRADPHNGLCLNALLDRAFDRGLFTFDTDLRVILSRRLETHPELDQLLAPNGLATRSLLPPVRFAPDPTALEYHRTRLFQR